ncbi:hypothetical protein ACFZB9_36370 [Kitasatospora sp. NPDC008050]|uniref:hypothetical protein n=1 Tax=Kitasatospora sp. NPDC008050 TaxID=3364021 RepID=UPI0036E38988
MGKSFRALAVGAIAVASEGLASSPAFADSYSRYQGGVVGVGETSYGCAALLDGMHDDTQNYWVARGAFQSITGTDCHGALYRKSNGSSTWTLASNIYAFSVPGSWVRTGYHWDGPGAQSKVCVNVEWIDPLQGNCSAPW